MIRMSFVQVLIQREGRSWQRHGRGGTEKGKKRVKKKQGEGEKGGRRTRIKRVIKGERRMTWVLCQGSRGRGPTVARVVRRERGRTLV